MGCTCTHLVLSRCIKESVLCWKDRIMLHRWKSSRRMCLIKSALCSFTAVTWSILEHEFMPGKGRQEQFSWRQLGSRGDEKGKCLAHSPPLEQLIMILSSFYKSAILLRFLDALRCHSDKIFLKVLSDETQAKHSWVSDPVGWSALALTWLKISWCNLFKILIGTGIN